MVENAKQRNRVLTESQESFPLATKTTDGLFIMYMQSVENTKEKSKEMKLKSKSKQEAKPRHFSSFTLEPC